MFVCVDLIKQKQSGGAVAGLGSVSDEMWQKVISLIGR